MYSESKLEFIRKCADIYTNRVNNPALYTDHDVRELADLLLKEADMFGSGGWLWDTDMDVAGNLAGYGGSAGSIAGGGIGATAGGIGGTAVLPGAGTAAGGVAGGVAGSSIGGGIGRALGYGIGWGIDRLMGNSRGENQPGFMGTVFNKQDMAMDAGFGAIPGLGPAVRVGGKALLNAGGKNLLKKGIGKSFAQAARVDAAQQAKRWGMKSLAYNPAQSFARNMGAQTRNLGQNVARGVAGRQGLRNMGREFVQMSPIAALGAYANSRVNGAGQGMSGAGTTGVRPFDNTQGYTNVVGNPSRGLSGVIGT